MKANLNLPWYQLRQISRWLKTFDIRFSSEQSASKISKDWVGTGLQVEMEPLVQGSGKEVEIVERPWAYLYNVVGHILRQLQLLSNLKLLVNHKFIHPEEVHIKIGGGYSFKMGYQIANVLN